MALIACPECRQSVSDQAIVCPHCGILRKDIADLTRLARFSPFSQVWWLGYEWKSKTMIAGLPLVHIAIGRSRQTGRLLVARGIIAIGQFACGVVTIAQFGIGVLFGFGQFVTGVVAIGQFAAGIVVVAQLALGIVSLAQCGFGPFVWSTMRQDPAAREFFLQFWRSVAR